MDAEKIVQNMKAVLKKAKRKKSFNKKHSENNINENFIYADNAELIDAEISELMTKNWQMKTPPINKMENEANKQKVNAFEKMMSRRCNPDLPSQSRKLISPEVTPESNSKVKRKYIKKHKSNSNINGAIDNEMTEDSSSIINNSTSKRTRTNDACLENSSKKRRIKDDKMQLDSNENPADNAETDTQDNNQAERPKRSCISKIDYSLFANSPEKDSPEKRPKLEKKHMPKALKTDENLKIKESKENVKLAPLFTKKPQKNSTLQENNFKTEADDKYHLDSIKNSSQQPDISLPQEKRGRGRPRKPCVDKVDSQPFNSQPENIINIGISENALDENEPKRPRRSCVNKMDYSQFIDSPEKVSPEKRPLRSKSEIENIVNNSEADRNAKINSNLPIAINNNVISNLYDDSTLKQDTQETLQSGRPRRSCINKVDYLQLLGSPEKTPEKKNNPKSKAEEHDDVIFVDENSPIKKKVVKLAPLFEKRVPKPAIDPAILEARRNFLLSELPESLRAPIEKQRQFVEEILSNDMVAFPKISHITQLKDEYEHHHTQSLFDESKIRIIGKDMDDLSMEGDMIMKCGLLTDCSSKDFSNPLSKSIEEGKLQPISDIKEAVKKIKDSSGSFPVNRCFKQILSKLKVAKENDEENENGISYLNSSFVEIFKPSSFEEVLIGLEPVKSLQDFLNSWNDRNSKYDNYDSDDSSSRHSMKGLNNCAVLSGKNGHGKTLSVFALANDFNFEVIEINAGSKRSGKKILQDLLEATQSHRVEKNLMDDESSSDHFQNDAIDRKTIILIEDAELTFENDDGFISSIQQLIYTSKRPVILTTNDPNCQHLQKFIQHNEIIYDSPKNYVTKYLSLISLATANYQIDEEEIEYLYTFNRCDLRKTINEIEFFIRSENASVNSGSLMGLFCDTKNKNRLQKGSQLAFHSQRDLSTLRSRSSIISDYSALLSCSQQVFEGGEISYHQQNLMNEMANFFKRSNLLKMEYQNDLAQSERQRIISSSISNDVCSINTSTRAKHIDYSPLLRHICRSEKTRDISRRTNRSHYLRHHLSNTLNANEYFNSQCLIFEEDHNKNI